MKSSKIRQVVLPLITALIWGSAFVTQSLSAAHLGCFSFNALRAIPAVLVLLVLTPCAAVLLLQSWLLRPSSCPISSFWLPSF